MSRQMMIRCEGYIWQNEEEGGSVAAVTMNRTRSHSSVTDSHTPRVLIDRCVSLLILLPPGE